MGAKSQLDVIEKLRPVLVAHIRAMRLAGDSFDDIHVYLLRRGITIDRRSVERWFTRKESQ